MRRPRRLLPDEALLRRSKHSRRTDLSQASRCATQPRNGFFALEGDVLYPPPPLADARLGSAYLFLSTRDDATRSRFGWVRAEESFTIESFVSRCFSAS